VSFNPEQKAADDNTQLQLTGARKQMRLAGEAIANSLRLGGELIAAEDEMRALLTSVVELQTLTVVAAYRHKMPFDQIAQKLGMNSEQVLRILLSHFDTQPALAHEWLTAETERRSMAEGFGIRR
jgi:hypothetical protein